MVSDPCEHCDRIQFQPSLIKHPLTGATELYEWGWGGSVSIAARTSSVVGAKR